MAFIVNDNCIKCKYTDCVEVCPVDCFYEGENMLVINPDECIDCGVCEPECPALAIIPDTRLDPDDPIDWVALNLKYSLEWPVITEIKEAPEDADSFNPNEKKGGTYTGERKLNLLSETPGEGDV